MDTNPQNAFGIASKTVAPVVEIKPIDKETVLKVTTSVDFRGIKTTTEETVDIKAHNALIDKQIAILEARKIK